MDDVGAGHDEVPQDPHRQPRAQQQRGRRVHRQLEPQQAHHLHRPHDPRRSYQVHHTAPLACTSVRVVQLPLNAGRSVTSVQPLHLVRLEMYFVSGRCLACWA